MVVAVVAEKMFLLVFHVLHLWLFAHFCLLPVVQIFLQMDCCCCTGKRERVVASTSVVASYGAAQ